MPTVTVELATLHPGQLQVVRESARFNVVCCGRRWGKSTLGVDLALDLALDGKRVAYYEPTYKMLAEVWREVLRQLPPPIGKPSAQEHRIDLATGGSIELWSLDSPDSSRGRAYHRVIVDEAAMVPLLRETWQAVIRPTLTDFEGDAWFLSTPRGFNEFFTLYSWGQSADRPEWRSWRKPSTDNPHIPAPEVEAARGDMDPRLFGQEYEADFTADARAVFDSQYLTPSSFLSESMDHKSVMSSILAAERGLTVYRPRRADRTYLLGADVAQGLAHGDASACTVLEVVNPHVYVEAAHLHGRWPPDVFAGLLDALGRHYGGLLAVERNNHGWATLQKLKELRASSYAPYRLYHDQQPLRPNEQIAGWNTTRASKPLMISELEEAIRKRWVYLGTEALLHELRAYQRLDNGDTSAPDNQHDDRVIGLALAWQMRKYLGQNRDASESLAVDGLVA